MLAACAAGAGSLWLPWVDVQAPPDLGQLALLLPRPARGLESGGYWYLLTLGGCAAFTIAALTAEHRRFWLGLALACAAICAALAAMAMVSIVRTDREVQILSSQVSVSAGAGWWVMAASVAAALALGWRARRAESAGREPRAEARG
jgi:hypothetical protein